MPGRHCVELRLGKLDHLAVRIAVAPMVSVLSVLTDAARRRTAGMPAPVRRAAEAIAPLSDGTAVRPIIAPGRSVVPDTVIPIPPSHDVGAEDHLDYLRASPENDLIEDIDRAFGGAPPAHWRPVADRPRRWLSAYAETAGYAWEVLAPLWRHAEPLLRREIERTAVASARRQVHAVLDDLSPKARLHGESLFFADPEPAVVELGGRPLVLVPILAGPGALVTNFDRDDCVWIGYPVRGLDRLRPRASAHRGTTAADLVLGSQRADILRLLERPEPMSHLVASLHYAPSTLSYHCKHLVEAGLIATERDGRRTRLSRTERGTAVLHALAGD